MQNRILYFDAKLFIYYLHYAIDELNIHLRIFGKCTRSSNFRRLNVSDLFPSVNFEIDDYILLDYKDFISSINDFFGQEFNLQLLILLFGYICLTYK